MIVRLLTAVAATAGILTPSPSAHRLRDGDHFAIGRISNAGNGIAVANGAIGRAVVHDADIDGVYRVVETEADASGWLTIENIRAVNVRRGLARIRGTLTGVVRNCDISFSQVPQIPPNLPAGLAFDGEAHDWAVENVTIRGAQMTLAPDRYWNGDGISTEVGNRNFLFRNVRVYDSTDSGFDLKSSNTRLDNTLAQGNSRNYRFWKDTEAGTIISVEPLVRGGRTNPAHIWVTGKFTPTIRIKHLVVRATRSRAAVIRVEDGAATVIIESADIQVPPGTPLVVGSRANVQWLSGTPRI